MKIIFRPRILLFVFLGLFLISSLSAQKVEKSAREIQPPTGWKGRIEIRNGVRTVINPDKPLYGEFAFDLERDLVIGDENDEHKTFYKGAAIQVDDQGCIYALDYEKSCILKFDPSGRYLITFGRKGQGPGELEMPGHFYIDASGRIMVLHGMLRTVEVFKPDGSCEKRMAVQEQMADFFLNADKGFFAKTVHYDNKADSYKTYSVIIEINPEGNTVRTLASVKNDALLFLIGGSLFGSSDGHHYSEELHFLRIGENAFCYGRSGEYRIMIVDGRGDNLRTIVKNENPLPIGQKIRREYTEYLVKHYLEQEKSLTQREVEDKIKFPDHRPFFSGMLADDQSRLYVERFRDSTLGGKRSRTEIREFDVFNIEGIYIYRLKIPLDRGSIIKNGFLYSVESDEESGSFRIVRYKIKNYDKMKGGQ